MGVAARLRTSLFVMWSYHFMPRIRVTLRMRKVLSLLSCLEYRVHDSLPYKRALMTEAL